jgi:hypothetical protein
MRHVELAYVADADTVEGGKKRAMWVEHCWIAPMLPLP